MWLDMVTRDLVRLALAEDLGRGDLTTEAVIPADATARASVWIKEPSRVCGTEVAAWVFHEVDPGLQVTVACADGIDLDGPRVVMRVEGAARSILGAERTALNFLSRLTGIATAARDAVREIAGTRARILDTRKTTPGWRALEKYAVRVGGGWNHRFALDDMVLIKDNHIAIAGGVREAVSRAKARAGFAHKIEVEVESLEQLEEAIAAGADVVLLDNMDLEIMREAVRRTGGRVPLEASGNMRPGRLRAVADTGVDFISMSHITMRAQAVDVGLDIDMDLA
ncbi:carboxylating nicotinate-nucleotide diphosphorylase [Alicyclobacillus acidocaldarius]|uniref:Probable nicotinate-nucleotide pyrophosphorylase [carboxylating] n=1 Tax=Alicyclobacillus acidocaldarius subsp. acidocaldarius (strain ATCC 27009 / DSM 446 / BCRC 14685 / JCM 5260 / KCTC 1825 / NBRC 15652 / NCIMB 11725 / NRRL B-14509 / 104-IA) TaxID=521098 RepID=C8WSJ9_ALIAD|nr:carboxylating nicotinate-nucleotide diphosphorylase [Alicyclobacillus acidocaldarius]ACV59484.1 nicotinate-nucleotide pyrophosphorylase [Alicyclobacillus acidocaldarius subsp. acidocaldarius DSM 446]